MKKGYKSIEKIEDNSLLKQTIPADKLKQLSANIERLETLALKIQISLKYLMPYLMQNAIGML